MNESGFDATVWQAQKGNFEPNNPRLGMITGLEKYHIKVGMKREKIRQLLGEPDTINDQIDIYDIGVSPFGVDLETYQINYRNGAVIKFYTVRN